MRLTRRVFGDHGKNYFAGMQILHTLFTGQKLAVGRKNGRDTDQILCGNAGVTQRQFKRGEPLTVLSDSLGEENSLGNHVFAQFASPPQKMKLRMHNLTQWFVKEI